MILLSKLHEKRLTMEIVKMLSIGPFQKPGARLITNDELREAARHGDEHAIVELTRRSKRYGALANFLVREHTEK